MRENGEGSRKWFSINSKSFEISVEGEGSKQKGFITERRKGFVSWIRFGEVGLKNLLLRVETVCKEESNVKRVFEWRENGRAYRMDNRENEARCFLLYSVTDGDGKRHRIFFPEGKGLIKGWKVFVRDKGKGGEKREKSNKDDKREGKGGKWVSLHAWPGFESKNKGRSSNA